MPYYKEINVLFIHIPKTGGTVIENSIKKHANQTLYSGKTNTLLDSPYNNISLQHQVYTTLYEFKNRLHINFDNIKIFCVVRDPYDRIISDLFWYGLIETHFDSNQVYHVIKNNYLHRTDLDNHNIPQYKFITDENGKLITNIKILKTETLNEENDELNIFLEFDVNIKQPNVNKDYSKYLNNESISLINIFYKTDFELFNYTFIPVV